MSDHDAVIDQKDAEMLLWAEKGDAQAQLQLGHLYGYKGTAHDDEDCLAEAARWYLKASDKGVLPARVALAEMYLDGRGVRQDTTQALSLLRSAVAEGDNEARLLMGDLYLSGSFVEKDVEAAVALYQAAGNNGDMDAQNTLGCLFMAGRGPIKADLKKAVVWHKKAAEQGHPMSQMSMGCFCQGHLGVKPNLKDAELWHRKAAHRLEPQSFMELGFMYGRGDGVKRNATLGLMFLLLADKFGLSTQYEIAMERQGMSVAELTKAEQLAGAWKPPMPLPTPNMLA